MAPPRSRHPAAERGGRLGWLRDRTFPGPVPLLEPTAWLLAAGYAVSALLQALSPGPAPGGLIAMAALSALLLAGIAAACHRVADGVVRWRMAVGVGALILLNASLRVVFGPGVENTAQLGLVIVALGAFLPGRAYLALVAGAGLTWLAALPRYTVGGLGAHYSGYLAASAGLGLLLLLAREHRDEELARARSVEDGLSEDLRVSLGWYKKLFHESPALMCVHDTDGRIEEVNPAGLRALGYDRQDVVGGNIKDFMVPVTEDGPASYLMGIQSHGWTEGLLRARRADGSLRIWEYRSTMLRTGGEVQILATAADITELAEARDWVPSGPDPMAPTRDG